MNKSFSKRPRLNVSKRGVFLAAVVLICLLPLVWTLLASLQIWPIAITPPVRWVVEPSLERYLEVGIAEPHFADELFTSVFLAACTTFFVITIAFFAAFGIARSHFRGRNILVQSFLVLASLPVISYVLPLSNVLDGLRLSNTVTGLIFAETSLYTPLAVYVLFGYLKNMSEELEQAAYLEGATLSHTLRKVVLPVSLPGIAATAIIVYVLSWNQVLIPLVLGSRVRTVPTAMIDFFVVERELEWPTAAAALIVSLLPIGIFVGLAHRLLEQFHLGASANL